MAINTTTTFAGIKLKNPVVIASSTLTESFDAIRKCEENGAAAVIAKSCSSTRQNIESFRRSFVNDRGWYLSSGFNREIQCVDESLAYLRGATSRCSIPIFASASELTMDAKTWLRTCKLLEKTRVAGIQLDLFYFEKALVTPGFRSKFVKLLRILSENLDIPIFPKLSINLPSALMIDIFREAGINDVAFLDSVKVPAPIDINGVSLLENVCNVKKLSLYGGWQYPLTLKYLNEEEKFSVCAGGGVQNASEIIELLLLGADSIQIATSIIFGGYRKIRNFVFAVEEYMEKKGFANLEEFRGAAIVAENEKKYQSKMIHHDSSKCVNCERCHTQGFCSAITLNLLNQIEIDRQQCESCSFCVLVCSTNALHYGD